MNATRKPARAATQVLTVRINPAVLDRLDELKKHLQADRVYQLRGIEDRSDVLRLVIEKGITELEKELKL